MYFGFVEKYFREMKIIKKNKLTNESITNNIFFSKIGEDFWTDYTVKTEFKIINEFKTEEDLTGLVFRYRSALRHYGFFLKNNLLVLTYINENKKQILESKFFKYQLNVKYELKVKITGQFILCYLNNKLIFSFTDKLFKSGSAGIFASTLTEFELFEVSFDDKEELELRAVSAERKILEGMAKASYSVPRLYKKIHLYDFGSINKIKFGNSNGKKNSFFIVCQAVSGSITCMTSVSIDTGRILWQKGKADDNAYFGRNYLVLPIRVTDVDNDGISEVICFFNNTIMVLDGVTGKAKNNLITIGKEMLYLDDNSEKSIEKINHKIEHSYAGEIITVYNGGNEIFYKEMIQSGMNVIKSLNWDGKLIFLNSKDGAIDLKGYRVLCLPKDGHPEICSDVLDIVYDSRDEIIVWDRKNLYIYTQDN